MEGWDGKRLYVWFEAVIGYLSAAIEWAKVSGKPEAWKDWWVNPAAQAFYFIGKDNIFFHTAMWPAELMGAGEQFLQIFAEEEGRLTLPYDVPANQFMNLEGQKISGSRNWAVWGRDALTRYDPDALRYYLTINMPENHDSDWDWKEFVARNNGELVATWGNLANRVLAFCYKHWDGHVPNMDPACIAPGGPGTAGCHRGRVPVCGQGTGGRALAGGLAGSHPAGQRGQQIPGYLRALVRDQDRQRGGREECLHCPEGDRLAQGPVCPLPAVHQRETERFLRLRNPALRRAVHRDGEQTRSASIPSCAIVRTNAMALHWKPSELKPGAKLNQPAPLFKKLEESVIEEERARLGIIK